jgi:hypothetical protein
VGTSIPVVGGVVGGGGVVAGGFVAGGNVAGGKVAGGNVKGAAVAGGKVGATVVGGTVVVVVVVDVVVVVRRVVVVLDSGTVVDADVVVLVSGGWGLAVASESTWVSTIAMPKTPAITLRTTRPDRLSSQFCRRVSRSSGLSESPPGRPMSRFDHPSQPAPPAAANSTG